MWQRIVSWIERSRADNWTQGHISDVFVLTEKACNFMTFRIPANEEKVNAIDVLKMMNVFRV